MEFNAPAELGWQALKYAARRLPDTDCAAFEEQLAEDQTAREAVAQAVELSHTVAVLHACGGSCDATAADSVITNEPTADIAVLAIPSIRQWTWQRAAGWMGLGVAACLAVVLASSHWFAANSARDQATANDLVSANWADLRNAREGTDLPLLAAVAVNQETTFNEGLPADSSEEAGMVPDWLLMGVEKDSP